MADARKGTTGVPLLTGVLDIVVRRLPEHQSHERAPLDGGGELAPDGHDDVLGRWNDAAHERDVEVEILVVDQVDRLLLHDPLEHREVDHVAGPVVDLSAYGDVERVVVA